MASEDPKGCISENKCGLCKNSHAKYCCPRCNILYCSLTCYTSAPHIQCSEGFYEECVKESFDQQDPASKAKMMDILKRQHENNEGIEEIEREPLDSDDEVFDELGERLAGVDLDDAGLVWSKLTDDERQEFEAFLKSGEISKLVPTWDPWWSFHTNKKVLDVTESNSYRERCPKLKEHVKDMSALFQKKRPAEQVKYNIINTLTAYAFTARYFNGEYHDFPREASSCVANLSLALKINHNFEDFSTAVEAVHAEIIGSDWIHADEENINKMREDIHSILKGPHKMERKYYVFAGLSDCCHLMGKAASASKNKKVGKNEKVGKDKKVDKDEKVGKDGKTGKDEKVGKDEKAGKDKKVSKDKKVEEVAEGAEEFSEKFPDSSFPPVLLESAERLKQHLKKLEFYLAYVKDCWND